VAPHLVSRVLKNTVRSFAIKGLNPGLLPTNILQEDDESPDLSPEDSAAYRSLIGAFPFLLLTRLDLSFAVSFFGRYNQQSTEKSYRLYSCEPLSMPNPLRTQVFISM
jgi:hypothetical protein